MELQITGKGMDLKPEVRSYIERKLGKLSRYLPGIVTTHVEIAGEKTKSPEQHFVVQVTIDSNNSLLRGEERGADLFTAIDKVAEVMGRRIERYKGKQNAKGRGSVSARSEFSEITEAEMEAEVEPAGKVVKVKRFAIKPMSVDEAVDQMELLSHDFFLFFNSDTEALGLLYRRRDGDYGLIALTFYMLLRYNG